MLGRKSRMENSMATDRLTCARCDKVLDAITSESEAEASAEFEQRFKMRREPGDILVCSTCYEEILMGFVMRGMFGDVGKGTVH